MPDQPSNVASVRYNPSLTGIRGIAAIWVYLYHVVLLASVSGNDPHLPGQRVFYAGYLAVDLFFVLSGFVLTRAHAADFATISRRAARKFYEARWWRVYPPSFVALLLVSLLLALDEPFRRFYDANTPGGLTPSSFVATALLATRWTPQMPLGWNGPVWSLSAEIVAYAAFPLLAWVILRLRDARVAVAGGVAATLVLIAWQTGHGDLANNPIEFADALTRVALCFLAGALFERAAHLRSDAPHRLATGSLAAAGSILAIIVLMVPYRNMAIVLFGPLLLCLEGRTGLIYRLLSSRTAVFLGQISFPLYLIHSLPLSAYARFAADHHLRGWAFWLLQIPLGMSLLALAAVLHFGVERPAHRLARRLDRPEAG